MKDTRIHMGMPIEVEVVGVAVEQVLEEIFAHFKCVDEQFSPYTSTSEVSQINRGELSLAAASPEMREIIAIGDRAKGEARGYFNIYKPDGRFDPSGVVKGWAIHKAAALARAAGYTGYFINAGGDIAMSGKNEQGEEWSVGIRNPFNIQEIVKVVYPHGKGIATSGSYIRGAHIYNPLAPEEDLHEIVSITVIGPDVLEADLMATASFAMGRDGAHFIEGLDGFDAYAIDKNGTATLTSGFPSYLSS